VHPRALPDSVPVHGWIRDTPALFDLLHRAKYGAEPALLDVLIDSWAKELVATGLPTRAVLVPLPDDAYRRRQRGYGVTERIACRLADATGLVCEPSLLRRRGRSRPQARQPDDRARRCNVRGRFGAGDLSRIDCRRPLLLVEDQITSGATVREAVRVLAARGHPVAVLAMAASSRAPKGVGP
jgi:predicted amidophosphoribosyltransferase